MKNKIIYYLAQSKNLKINVKVMSIFVVGLCLLLAGLSYKGARTLNTEYSFSQFFPAKHPLLEQSQKNRQTFRLEERSSFLVVLEKTKGTWLNKNSIQSLSKINEQISQIPGVRSSMSIATIEGAIEDKKNLNIGPLYEQVPVRKWSQFTKSNKLIYKQLISEDFKSVLLVIEPELLTPNKLQIVSQNIRATLKKEFPNELIQIGGGPAVQARFSQKLFQELKLFLTLSLIVFALVYLAFFKGLSAFVLTFFALVFSNLVVIGTVGFMNIPFSVLLSTLPIIVSISLISLMIHTLHRWAEVLHKESSNLLTLEQRFHQSIVVIKEMSLANFLGSMTTAIGFIALCVTDIPLIRQYGWVVALSILISWLIGQGLLFGFMVYTRPTLRGWAKQKSYWTLHILKHSHLLFVGLIGITLFFSYKGKEITFSGKLFDDLPKNDIARRTTEKIDKKFGGVVTYDLILESSSKNYWKSPKQLQDLSQFTEQIRKLPSIGSAISLTDFFTAGKISSSQAIAETMFLYSISSSNPLKNYVTEDAKSVRLAIRLRDVPSHNFDEVRRRIKGLALSQFAGIQIKESGLGLISHSLNQEVSKNLVSGFWHSLLIIGGLLMFIFKSLRWALVACLPNLIPPAVLLGLMAIAQTPIKPGVALIFSIALGLAFNNTVYLLSRLKKLMAQKGMHGFPLKQALLQEGNPCLFETLIMFCGFIIFVSSGFKANQIFGIYMVLSIIAGALGDLVFLPTMLKLFPGMLKMKELIPVINLESKQLVKSVEIEKIAAGLLVVFMLMVPAPSSAENNEVKDLLNKIQQKVEAKDDQATVKMKIIEANGEIKVRNLDLQTMKSEKFLTLVRIQSPADIKGTALLSEIKGEQESQWLYLPSSKQVRRVVSNKKTAGVLGSELTIEDLNSAAIRGAQIKIAKKDSKIIVLELTPKKGTSIYNKVLTTISSRELLPVKTEYFMKNKLSKTVEFLDYKKIGNQAWRAQTIKVRNLKNKRGTDLQISNAKVNSGLSPDDFTVSALKE